ncbi:uncharacterized protein [Epargyreus clarus]|uniref:uncharacterized protein n=1 Tax=Epargyreus clarus TaxID=520877 RepID=UPI003C30B7D8
MIEEPLQLLPVEKWSELEDVFKADWPRSISGFMVLDRQKYLLQRGFDYGFKVYCPFGDVNNGMVALNIKNKYYEVIIQCASDDTSILEDALRTTKIIDWTRQIEAPFAPDHVMSVLRRIIEYKRLVILFINASTAYMLDKNSRLFDMSLPQGLSFEPLPLKYANLVASTWPHGYPNCHLFFEILIKAKMGYGLFRDGKLISWVLIRESGSLLHLYTVQEERKKGYGELVLKLISDVLRKEGKHVLAFCAAGNDNAAKLYQKLNFEAVGNPDWCTFTESSQ